MDLSQFVCCKAKNKNEIKTLQGISRNSLGLGFHENQK